MSPQTIITLPLLEGLDGIKKMSKSEDNYIGITETADDVFGKTMSIPDEIMFKWFDLLSLKSATEIKKLKASLEDGGNPRDVKILLALELTERFISKDQAENAKENFFKKFAKNELPSDIEEKSISYKGAYPLPNLLKDIDFAASTSEALRLIKQGAVKVNQVKIDSKDTHIEPGVKALIQVGKKKVIYVLIKGS
jgi:tyrosyl-tRNA synthetase